METEANLSVETDKKRPPVSWRSRNDRLARRVFFFLSAIPVGLTLFLVTLLVVKSWPLLGKQNLWQLLAGQTWKPEEGIFGFWPFISGTLWVTAASLVIALPPSFLSAI